MKKIIPILALLSLIQLNATAQDTTIINFSGGPAQWTLPAGYSCDIEITVAGASGGATNTLGGAGAVISGTIPTTPGMTLDIIVGGQGACPGAGFNGGGIGFASTNGTANYGSCGGGGSTNVNINGTPFAIAAGGGGAGGGSVTNNVGGSGGCATGVNGGNTYGQGGQGGTQVAAGNGGTPWAGTPPGGSNGVGSVGGMGGLWQTASGGGGGGGYFGGGGGGNDGCCTGANGGGGGGGGSSLIPGGVACNVGSNIGNGYVMIILPPCATLMCAGDTSYIDFAPSFPVGSTNFTVVPAASAYQAIPGDANIGFHPLDTTVYDVTANTPTGPLTLQWTVNTIDPIMPDAGLDDSICFAGGPANLTATLFNDGIFYWDFSSATTFNGGVGTGTIGPNTTSLSITASANLPGYYEYILYEEDTLGICAVGSDTVYVYYSEESHTSALVNPSCFGYADGSITVTSDASALSGSIGAVEYSIDGGLTWQASNTFNGLPSGSYDVMSRDYLGCDTMITVLLVDPPAIGISFVSSDTLICQNGTATLIAVGANAPSGIYTYTWDAGTSVTSQNVITPSPAGTDMTVSVYATSDIGCFSDTISQTITHRAPLNVSISDNDTICPGDLSYPHLTSVGGGYLNGIPDYTYSWTQNGATYVSTNDSLFVDPTAVTTYCITANDGCETTPVTACSEVHMRRVPSPMFTSDLVEGCNPTTITFDNLTDPIDVDSVRWHFAGQYYSDINQVIHEFDQIGFYEIQLEVFSEYGCYGVLNVQDYIQIHDNPDPELFLNPNPTTIFDTEIQFNQLTPGTNTYSWSMPGGSPSSSTDESLTVFYPEGIAADYPVTLTVTSDVGCVTEISSTIHIYNDVLIYAPSIFTPDGDEFNETWQVYIDGIDIYDYHLTMFNRWGEPVWESYNQTAQWKGTYGPNGLMDGTFVWVIECKDYITDKKYEFRGHVTVLK